MDSKAKTTAILVGAAVLGVLGLLANLSVVHAPAPPSAVAPASIQGLVGGTTPAPAPIVLAPAAAPVDAFLDATRLAPSDLLRLEPALSHPVLLAGDRREVYLQALVSAKAGPPTATARRSRVHLALVIDTSGSMEGDKLESTKSAARELLMRLEEGDRLAVVGYSDSARRVLSSTRVNEVARARALAAIESIRAGGSTNLSSGVDLAERELLADREGEKLVHRIVLLSDGQANLGEIRPERLFASAAGLRERGVTLSSIGVGVDFNAQLMEGLAEHGGGRFRFLENPQELAAAFTKELDLAATMVAGDVKVVLRPADGTHIEDVYGHLYERVGRDVVVSIPDLATTTQIRVLARLSVQAVGGNVPVVESAVSFAEIVADRGGRVAVRGPALAARITSSAEEVGRLADTDVLTHAINGRGIVEARRAIELYDQGRREEALASLDRATDTVSAARVGFQAKALSDSGGIFGNLRVLFAASSNALGGEEGVNVRRTQRKAIRDFGSNNLASE
ncbi:MAG: VWA domain-containing protein [Deltaproteobacteria bacterium]|nr:VWA domain-containing protein [Deltaproteobacteria bacterium]